MKFLDVEGSAEFPYPANVVFDAVLKVVPTIKGMKVDNHNKAVGQVSIKVGMSLSSFGEKITVSVTQTTPDITLFELVSKPKGGLLNASLASGWKAREDTKKIIEAVNAHLEANYPRPSVPVVVQAPTPQPPPPSPTEQLAKLNDLLEKGLISGEEYQRKRGEILSRI